MPFAQQDHPEIILYPSSQEDAIAYMVAIRNASAVRNSIDAQKAGADGRDGAIDNESSGRHYPDVPAPALANLTTPEAVPTLNQTSSAHFTTNISEPVILRPQDSFPSPSNSTDTAETPTSAALTAKEEHPGHVSTLTPPIGIDAEDTAADSSTGATLEAEGEDHGDLPPSLPPVSTNTEDSAADTHTSVTIEAMEEYHGRFPPPEPPIGATQGPPAEHVSGRALPMSSKLNSDTLRATEDVPNGVPPPCQLFATNTDIHTPFAVCPVTKGNSDFTYDLASPRLHSRDTLHSPILAIRNTFTCEAPTDFHERLVCGDYTECFALGFFILFSIICIAWILRGVRKRRIHRLDEENGAATWPRLTHVPSTKDSDAKDLKGVVRAHRYWGHGGESVGTEQYEPVAWRCSSSRAARANIEGRVEHDAGPVAGLPGIPNGV